MPQSVEMHRALKSERRADPSLRRAARAARLAELRHQLFKMNAEIEWFEKHATGRPYTPEKAPEEKKDVRITSEP